MNRFWTIPCLLLAWVVAAPAHELRPAYLHVRQIAADRYAMLWKTPARGPDKRLALHVRLPQECRVEIPPRISFTGDAYVESTTFVRAGGLGGSKIQIEGLNRTLTDALVRVEQADGSTQVIRLTPTNPSFVVETAPSRFEVARTYLSLGIEHILLGIDHLLFVLAVLMIATGWSKLLGTITAFTAAHSLTLATATLGFVQVPQQPVEAAISLSIVFVGGEIVHGSRGSPGLAARRPWIVAFAFGLLHGFGFAGALNAIGLPDRDIPTALLFFNVGVEFGQLAFVGSVLLVGWVACRLVAALRSFWVRLTTAYAIGGVATFWTIDRVMGFWQ